MDKTIIGNYIRISKKEARKRYEANKVVFILPAKANPSSMWFNGFEMTNGDQTFDQYVNAFTYYNCCMELGTYPAFYKTA